ncbi:2-succinyl-5-enolpyruvyl-6-hydroxy-3-cyclohexene-1-carboxylic-acid synthase [Xylanibacter muris]|uniref:2-succinyl-5-enolpyruvyl-6-hydroxy-3-cyclohexene-1-carboxylate synthase n=1 Tax=Xylanibacter muris TaxID=2736290 RepID=A0ABX2ALT1_9BACT|nr:2-succinyl-5-enolpyruvyl-6-hydroxy-3-cyclohexene-1-carboxylic-acid synthase [Xylanibacter muris]NPD92163.1 2-succinyl-5-enolpyruvyl-6-hydroxy-3-cyclohexene-1-carboxylic-acid synthase [Xylanibacter muris]
MFGNKENINILTALLIAHGVKDVVVCPGSRNAPIVHNMNECGEVKCHPVTDERSAGFYAMGLSQATGHPVVVCVTSGTALLNLAPAVAEAYFQHVPVVVVSADRPSAWIGQLDGQTLQQPGAFGCFVRKTVNLPEPQDDTERWYCNRLVNEAMIAAGYGGGGPVHINVPISEPLFVFDRPELPNERVISFHKPDYYPGYGVLAQLNAAVSNSTRPMVVIGKTVLADAGVRKVFSDVAERITVIGEPLNGLCSPVLFDETIRRVGNNPEYMPDLVIYIGDTIVSKCARKFLREAKADTWMLTVDGSCMPDPLMSLTHMVECHNLGVMADILSIASKAMDCTADEDNDNLVDIVTDRSRFRELWSDALAHAAECAAGYVPRYSQMAAVKYLEEQLEDIDRDVYVHYANSSAVRLANIYASHYVYCNRGVNGIEGSLSTAAGFSVAVAGFVVCVIGDLSFFYDQNALWNSNIGGNLRIILLNNHGGGIFHRLVGLDSSPVAGNFIAASHGTDARGICTQNDIGYMKADDMDEMRIGIVTLLTRETGRPMLLEVFTDSDDDKKALDGYYSCFMEE